MNYIFHTDERSVADQGDEFAIQTRLRKAIKSRLRGAQFIAVPNGGQRTAWAGIKAKQEGMQKGFPDGLVIWNGGCAYVEMKAENGALSDAQIEWLNWLTRNGHPAGMFRSVDTCIAWLIEQGAPASAMAA